MAYTAYEESTGKALDGVEALCKHLTSSATFSTTTQPTLTEVEDWLTEGWRQINAILADYGYDVPSAPSSLDADARGVLQKYNVYWACAQAEYSQASAGFAAESGSRGDMFNAMFWGREAGFKQFPGIRAVIKSKAFELLGHTKSEALSARLSAGGISKDDKNTIKNDSDMDQYAFRRGQFDHDGTLSVEATRADL